MEPTHTENAGNSLPAAPLEQLPVVGAGAETGPASAERGSRAAERAPAPPTTGPPAATPAIPLPVPGPTAMAATPATPVTASGASGTALAADDADLIEKEWVTKAKQIVERTRDDPYKQSEDLTLFKADYMQKRYGKTIKVSR